MALPRGFLDALRARITLSEVVGRSVKLTRAGREFKACCPFHGEKTPSFYVNDAKGFYHCFGCGAHGDVIRFLTDHHKLPFMDAVKELAAQAGLEVPKPSPEDAAREERRATLMDALEAACGFFEHALTRPEGAAAQAYLAQRGVDGATAKRFRLGYAPAGDALLRAMEQRGLDRALLQDAGLWRHREDGSGYPFFRDRLMFPVTDMRGRVIAFGGRVLGDGTPKYINSPEHEAFDKGRTLYGLALAREPIGKADAALVVEGYMDVIALNQAGVANTVAPLGTALTEDQMRLLWRLCPEPVLCLDGDAAGQRAALRAAERIWPLLEPGKSLRFATLPNGQDPDDLVRNQGTRALTTLIKQAEPLGERRWRALLEEHDRSTPERWAAFDAAVRGTLNDIQDQAVRRAYETDWKDRLFALRAASRPPRAWGRSTAPDVGPAPATDPAGRQRLEGAVALAALIAAFPQAAAARAEILAALTLGVDDLDQALASVLAAAESADEGTALDPLAMLMGSALQHRVKDVRTQMDILRRTTDGDTAIQRRFEDGILMVQELQVRAELAGLAGPDDDTQWERKLALRHELEALSAARQALSPAES